MDKDTVVISLKEYNTLRDFKINTEKGLLPFNRPVYMGKDNPILMGTVFLPRDEATDKLAQQLLKNDATLKEKEEAYIKLRSEVAIFSSKLLRAEDDVKKEKDKYQRLIKSADKAVTWLSEQTIWQFLRWKKDSYRVATFIKTFEQW